MKLLLRIFIKLGKLTSDLFALALDREHQEILFMFLGRKLGFGLSLPCETEVSSILNVHPFDGIIRPIVVFDIGANIGDYTFAVLEKLVNVKVYAFEPNPQTNENLRKRFLGEDRVTISDYAIGRYNQTGYISSTRINDPSSEVSTLNENGTQVSIVNLQTFLMTHNLKKIDFIKIDVEGMDYEVLLGAGEVLDKVSVIQFEISPNSILKTSLKNFFTLLTKTHHIYIMTPKGLVLLHTYDFSYEIYWGANFVATIRTM